MLFLAWYLTPLASFTTPHSTYPASLCQYLFIPYLILNTPLAYGEFAAILSYKSLISKQNKGLAST